MSQDHLLECLLAAVSRPHRNCLQRTVILQKRCLRYASTKIPSTPNPNSLKTPPVSKIPLHVGLDRNPENRSAISKLPIPKGEKGENFTPSVLARPLGLQYPPRVGQNTPLDNRSWGERKQDLQDTEQVLGRRKILLRSFFRPYFQDRKYVNYHEGKSFVSNERLFRKDKALFLPNLWGETLSLEGDGPDSGRDTTPLLSGKVSIVAFHGPRWAELHMDTFLSASANPELEEIIQGSGGIAQRVNVNIQESIFNQWFVKMYKGRMRKMIPEDRWNKYFLVKIAQDTRRGFTEDIRDAMGLLNKNVGYVYLVDPDCRIRWAGSGNAWTGEVNSLNAGLKRLIQEASASKKSQINTAAYAETSVESLPKIANPA